MAIDIHVYGATWCGVTFGLRKLLMDARLPYGYHDVDHDRAADAFVRSMNDGERRFPMVVVEESVLTNPTPATLKRAIDEHRLAPAGPRSRRRDHEASPA